ncbi:hypothetical protein [Halomicrococcus sp. NG-SE-24]|uniref:hypothetical protein n=1 Tax=Halomicrococcus sp. NG-SE-24 TaxID=3436928 RepID=UPI003D97EDDB
MGRTNPTYREMIRAMEDRWEDYRRALRHEDQVAFDRLFEHAHGYADAGGMQTHQPIEIAVLVSIALAHQQRIDDLEERLDALEDDLNTDE